MMKWYILYVLGGNEEKICNFLKKEGFDAFVPKRVRIVKKQRIAMKIHEILFPNYIFIESELDHVSFYEKVKECKAKKQGIVKEIKYDNEGTEALKDTERELIEKLVGKNKIVEHSIGFIEGEKIMITEGPLMGFESQIQKIDRHKKKAWLNIDMLGQSTTVCVSLEIVSKI